jgi:hypothetical protein
MVRREESQRLPRRLASGDSLSWERYCCNYHALCSAAVATNTHMAGVNCVH